MKISAFILCPVMAICLVFSGCTYDSPSPESTSVVASCDTAAVRYDNYVAAVIHQNCESCHGPSSTIYDLSDYTKLQAIVISGLFRNRVIEGSPSFMPPSGALPQSTRNSLNIWLNSGACK